MVADPERGGGTICLAVSPAMKALGVPGRCRVFEIPKRIKYIMAPPRMNLYQDPNRIIPSVLTQTVLYNVKDKGVMKKETAVIAG